jgi:hypothetical protein
LKSDFSLEKRQEEVNLLFDDERNQPEAIDMKRDIQLARKEFIKGSLAAPATAIVHET